MLINQLAFHTSITTKQDYGHPEAHAIRKKHRLVINMLDATVFSPPSLNFFQVLRKKRSTFEGRFSFFKKVQKLYFKGHCPESSRGLGAQ